MRASTPDAIRDLHAAGLRLVMLTGDTRATAEAVARRVGIDLVEADVLPARKREVVMRLQQEGRTVAVPTRDSVPCRVREVDYAARTYS